MRYLIEKNSIQETLVIPLYGRALCSRKFPHLFADQTAAELLEQDGEEDLYVVTCFSDRDKLLSRVQRTE